MKYAHSDILDGGLTALKTAATRMLLVKTYASGDSYATVTGNQLGSNGAGDDQRATGSTVCRRVGDCVLTGRISGGLSGADLQY